MENYQPTCKKKVSASDIGYIGEQIAVDFLRNKGFFIIERNWRYNHDEIDIIAQKEDKIHFVEVKTRGNNSLILPEDAFNNKKNRTILRAANNYIKINDIKCEVQIDLIAVDYDKKGNKCVRYYPEAANIHW